MLNHPHRSRLECPLALGKASSNEYLRLGLACIPRLLTSQSLLPVWAAARLLAGTLAGWQSCRSKSDIKESHETLMIHGILEAKSSPVSCSKNVSLPASSMIVFMWANSCSGPSQAFLHKHDICSHFSESTCPRLARKRPSWTSTTHPITHFMPWSSTHTPFLRSCSHTPAHGGLRKLRPDPCTRTIQRI